MIAIDVLRQRLDLPARDDHRLASIRDAVVAMWERETGRPWLRRSGYVQTIRPPAFSRKVWLALRPVEAVTRVEEIVAGENEWCELSAAGWFWPGDAQIERVSGYWRRLVRVTYDGGVTHEPSSGQAATPSDIQEALVLQARYLLDRHAGEKAVLKSQAFEAGSTEFLSADLHPFFSKVAKQHRRKA